MSFIGDKVREVFNELYDSQMKEKGIIYPHGFDKKVPLPVSDEYIFNSMPDTIKKERKFLQYFDLLPLAKDEDGNLYMPIYGRSRIEIHKKRLTATSCAHAIYC